MICRLTHVLAAVLVAAALVSAQGPSAEMMFESARKQEVVDGDLKGAITTYDAIISAHAGNRGVVARALVAKAQCHEKLGSADAQQLYEQVLREFADQKEAADLARARLKAQSPGAISAESHELVARRLWEAPTLESGDVSPDGQWLSQVDWTTGNLVLRDVATGQRRVLTEKTSWEQSGEFAEESVFSPQGKLIAYSWFNTDSFYELRVIGPEAKSRPRVVYRNQEILWLKPTAWSPDGRHVLVLSAGRDHTNALGLISIEDGSFRRLKTFDWRYPRTADFSPDGRYIAYDFPPDEEALERDLYTLHADGSGEVALIQHKADDFLLGWAPDGRTVLFASDRDGNIGAWRVPVADGRPEERPERVKSHLGNVHPIGFTAKGSFFYAVMSGARELHIAALDDEAVGVAGASTVASDRLLLPSANNPSPVWAPDGETFAYIAKRPTAQAVGLGGTNLVALKHLKTGLTRELRLPLSYAVSIDWRPDGQTLLVTGENLKGQRGLFEVRVQDGQFSTIAANVVATNAVWSPEGRAVYYLRHVKPGEEGSRAIIRRTLVDGQEEEVYWGATGFRLSRDGRWLTFVRQSQDAASGQGMAQLIVVPATGGAPRVVHTGESLRGGTWSADMKYIYYAVARESGIENFRVPADGGAPQRVQIGPPGRGALSFHPHGGQVAFTIGDTKAETWVMEGAFRPVAPARKIR